MVCPGGFARFSHENYFLIQTVPLPKNEVSGQVLGLGLVVAHDNPSVRTADKLRLFAESATIDAWRL